MCSYEYTCVRDPSGHTKRQALGGGGRKGGSRGALCSPSPTVHPAHLPPWYKAPTLGSSGLSQDTAHPTWPRSPRAHPTPRPFPWLRTRVRAASWSAGTEGSPLLPLALGWRPGLDHGPLQLSQPPPRRGHPLSQQMSTMLGIPPGVLLGRKQPSFAGICHAVCSRDPRAGPATCGPLLRASAQGCRLGSGSLLWATVPSVCPSKPHYTEGPHPPQDYGKPL